MDRVLANLRNRTIRSRNKKTGDKNSQDADQEPSFHNLPLEATKTITSESQNFCIIKSKLLIFYPASRRNISAPKFKRHSPMSTGLLISSIQGGPTTHEEFDFSLKWQHLQKTSFPAPLFWFLQVECAEARSLEDPCILLSPQFFLSNWTRMFRLYKYQKFPKTTRQHTEPTDFSNE